VRNGPEVSPDDRPDHEVFRAALGDDPTVAATPELEQSAFDFAFDIFERLSVQRRDQRACGRFTPGGGNQ
jgi:hypothetical protein